MLSHPARTLGALAASALLLASLSACSRHTALTVQADLVAFMSASDTQATVSYSSGNVAIDLPPNPASPAAGASVDLTGLGVPSGAISAIDALTLDFAAEVRPDSTLSKVTASLYVAGSSETDVFQSNYLVGTVTAPTLQAGRSTAVTGSFSLDAQHQPAALQRVQSGSFRVGVRLSGSASTGGSVDVTLEHMVVSVSLPPGWGLP